MPAREYWDNDPDHPVEDWQAEVVNGDTRQSYAEWIAACVRAEAEEVAGGDDLQRGAAAAGDPDGGSGRPQEEAPQEVRDKIQAALEAGNVTYAPGVEEAVGRMKFDGSPADFTLVDVTFTFWGPGQLTNGGLGIDWTTASAGCGRCDFYFDKPTGQLRCANQAMSKQFIHSLLERMLEQTVLDD